ncbi:ubinuclein-2b isoform X2 [Hoplias malabaricus]|uniref:ubinuclein-2b isoform X2 n=1 Tax=Hoplias malabaricus TaxID=27720 RepID=UPI00346213B1
MADPRKVPFVTLASYSTAPEPKKRRREEEGEINPHHHHHHHLPHPHPPHLPRDGAPVAGAGPGSGPGAGRGGGGEDGQVGGRSVDPEPTVRLSVSLSEPNEHRSAEFSYSELLQQARARKVPQGLTPALDPNDPFADEDRERREVEALAKKFESKYGNTGRKKKKDRMQDLIDIGYGYDETDPFIDNSEAYDELVPASLTTKFGGFYINTGTLQFRPASESEDEAGSKDGNHFKKLKDGDERVIKKRKKKDGSLEEKKPRKNKVPKPGVSALNRPEKKKRKKLMKDSLSLAAMIRRFTREKEELRKKNPVAAGPLKLQRGPQSANRTLLNSNSVVPGNDLSMADLTNDPAVMSLLGSANDNEMLQDLMGDLDFGLLDTQEPSSPGQSENGSIGVQRGGAASRVQRTGLMPPPLLPDGLPAPLIKRIEDLRAASRQFDMEGRKKFFTLDMNNILLDIELQVQEQPSEVRSAVYSHLEAFVPCNKEALLKRMKKLSLNVQDDRLKNPLLKLKLAVCSAMPEQIARYNMDCMAKVAKQMSEDGERNGSEDEDEEKPGKRVMGPRKKFVWDDKLRTLLCNLVRVKLGCYEAGQNSPSPEDYLKAFMETEVKPLWPKGWMQARMLIKESRVAHGHLTGNTMKKKIIPTPKVKPKEGGCVQQPSASVESVVQQPGHLPRPLSPSEPICLSDSLDEDLGGAPSLDSISQALALLSSAAKGLIQSDSPASPEAPKPTGSMVPHTSTTPLPKKTSTTTVPSVPTAAVKLPTSSPHFVSSSSPSISRPSSVAVSSSAAVRSEGLVGVKVGAGGLSQVQRHSLMTAQRPAVAIGNKLSMPVTPSPPKPRPPPTASPLHPPHKGFNSPSGKLPMVTPPSHPKPSNNNSSRISDVSLTQSRPSVHPTSTPSSTSSPSSLLLAGKTPQALHTLQSKNAPHESPRPTPSPSPAQPKPQHQQSNFITPMQATLTKSPHSSNSPILKLTPRVATASVATSSPSASPSLRTPTLSNVHQYTSKSPGFHAGFSGVGANYNAPVGQQKNSSQVNSGSLTNTPSSITKPTPTNASPATGSANHGQRQRPAGVANQATKTMASVSSASAPQLPQVSSSSGALLGSGAPNLPLGFGMLGGLVPVSLPFQFPGLLNLPAPTATAAGANSNPTSSGYSLPPNVTQSQGGDVKRKTL